MGRDVQGRGLRAAAHFTWCNWDESKQNAVRDLFFSTITGQFGPPLAAIPNVNLFA